MTQTQTLRRLQVEVQAVEELLSRIGAATAAGIEALRHADPAALESALDARAELLSRSGPAIAALSLLREGVEPLDPAGVRAALAGTLDLAAELRSLESNLHVALSAVRDQARLDLRTLDAADAQTSRYRPLGQPHGASVDLTG